MLKPHGLNLEFKIVIGYNPFFGEFFEIFPTPAAAFATDIFGVEIFKMLHIRPCAPYNLRVGTKKNDVFPTLQLISVAGCENDVIFPFIGYFHTFLTTSVTLSPFISKSFLYPSKISFTSFSARTSPAISLPSDLNAFSLTPSAV